MKLLNKVESDIYRSDVELSTVPEHLLKSVVV